MNNYKDTLNLPETKFPMRANLTICEPIILERWYKEDLYNLIRTAKKGKKLFILHDGPPYANGNIHIGHSVNKILKDIIIKSKGLSGFDSPYIPGWDCHGLPIELKIEKLYGIPGKKLSTSDFRKKCREYANKQIEIQKKDLIRLGIFGDWKNPYLTMDFKIEANTVRTLGKIINNGNIFKGIKPVHWCTNCISSLSESEIEYYNKTSLSIYVTFHAINTNIVASKFGIYHSLKSISLIIWTTTPWTLPANRAILLHPNFTYQLIQANNEFFILVDKLVKNVMENIGIKKWIIIGHCKGSELLLLYFKHPFMNFSVPIILDENVILNIGTGIIHIAGGHGPEDFIISQKYNIEIINIVKSDGCYLNNIHPLLNNQFVLKSNKLIINLLNQKNTLLYQKKIIHTYPHCWRHKTPTIFRTTPQWFISMNKKGLRKKILEEIKNVHWITEGSQTKIKNMIKNRPDWCISRQRTWGVPMSLWIHNKTKQLHPRSMDLIEETAKQIEKKGIQAYWDLKSSDFINIDTINYSKISDTLDVWFDSGATHTSVIDMRPEFYGHTADMYLEGSDQYRGWFMSSLIISIAIKGFAPYKQVLTHGFTVDNKGRKMSKSLGNTISPQEITNKLGSDILRLWVASTDYTNEITVSNEIFKRISESYRKIRNTARFLLANLKGFDPNTDCIQPKKMIILDKWIEGQAQKTQLNIKKNYENYNFKGVVQCITQFCSITMGSFYLDIIKDRQYTTKKNSIAHRSCQTALFHIIEALVRWIAPIMSFTADEIWRFLPGKRSKYVFTEEWYDGLSHFQNNEKMNNEFWNKIIQIKTEVNKILEQARTNKYLKNPLEIALTLYTNNELEIQLKSLKHELKFIFLTSEAYIKPLNDAPIEAQSSKLIKELKINIQIAKGKKCPRCWHYVTNIKKVTENITLCKRCITNVIGNGEKRYYV